MSVTVTRVSVLSKRMNDRAGFWHVSFLPPVLHCVKRKFGYDTIRDAQESRGLGDVYKRQAFTVSRASNDPQQLSLAPGLPPAKSGRACYDNPTGREGGISIRCPTCRPTLV